MNIVQLYCSLETGLSIILRLKKIFKNEFLKKIFLGSKFFLIDSDKTIVSVTKLIMKQFLESVSGVESQNRMLRKLLYQHYVLLYLR